MCKYIAQSDINVVKIFMMIMYKYIAQSDINVV
jgi:hypothetical protein